MNSTVPAPAYPTVRTEAQARRPSSAPSAASMPGGGTFLGELLVAPLERAVALVQLEHIAMRIGQHLQLDVARGLG